MEQTLKINNLFRYATSELSQDAFICWLISHATAPGWDEEPQIRECAIVLLNKILQVHGRHWTNNMRVSKIHKQYKNIDVLVQIDDIYIVIEDKTFTGTHDDQINRYKKILVDEGIAPQNIICVYYKIEEQPFPESDVDFEFTRDILLDIFRPYKNIIINPIFSDYLDYLEWIEFEINSYQRLPISEWSYRSYVGFFKHLSNTILKSERKSWGYVSNPTGGFMGLWWFDILSSDDLTGIGLDEQCADELYLQIENDIIAVKYTVNPKKNPDTNKVTSIRWKLYDYFRQQLGDAFQKKSFRPGNFMTVGYVKYDETNYIEKLTDMKKALLGLLTNGCLI
jgi:hypothetical protein